jgi:hypothetical protein
MKIKWLLPIFVVMVIAFSKASWADDKSQIVNILNKAANEYIIYKSVAENLGLGITNDLLNSIEAEWVEQGCNGEAEVCGFDYHPIVCGQDYDAPELLYTHTQYKVTILAQVKWSKNEAEIHEYRFIKDSAGNLMLDGIRCAFAEKGFNW